MKSLHALTSPRCSSCDRSIDRSAPLPTARGHPCLHLPGGLQRATERRPLSRESHQASWELTILILASVPLAQTYLRFLRAKVGTERVTGPFLLTAVTVSPREGKRLAHATQHGRRETPAPRSDMRTCGQEGRRLPFSRRHLPLPHGLPQSAHVSGWAAPALSTGRVAVEMRERHMETWHTHSLFVGGPGGGTHSLPGSP